MTIELTKNIHTNWDCPDEHESAQVPLTDLAEIGTPVCPECDREMGLTETVTIRYVQKLGEHIKVGDVIRDIFGKNRTVKGWTGYAKPGYREVAYADESYEILYDNARYDVQ